MKSEYVYTALLDVLSYRHRLSLDVQRGEEKFREDLEQSLRVFDTVNTAIFNVQAISDTIIITCNSHDKFYEFLQIIKKVFVSFLERGLFIRGGIAYSKHFQNGRVTYSHAIAKAYELENEKSIYPRIVFDKNIIDMYKSSQTLAGLFDNDSVLARNGTYYLNIVSKCDWDSVYEHAKRIYQIDEEHIVGMENVFLKHVWFEGYLFESKHVNPSAVRYIPKAKYM